MSKCRIDEELTLHMFFALIFSKKEQKLSSISHSEYNTWDSLIISIFFYPFICVTLITFPSGLDFAEHKSCICSV